MTRVCMCSDAAHQHGSIWPLVTHLPLHGATLWIEVSVLDLSGVVQPAGSLNHIRDSDDVIVISYPGEDVLQPLA